MGQNQSGFMPDGQQGDKKKKPEKKKWQPPAPPTRVGKKLKKKGLDGANRLPNVTPASKCLLRKLKLERVKDWLLMEEEFVGNQERIKPHTERAEEEKSKVDDLRGAPMSVGNLEEIIDDKCVARRRLLNARDRRRFTLVPIAAELASPRVSNVIDRSRKTRVVRARRFDRLPVPNDGQNMVFFRRAKLLLADLARRFRRHYPRTLPKTKTATPSFPRPWAPSTT
jgi:hypothetical protein